MKKILFLISALAVSVAMNAQSVTIFKGADELVNFSPAEVDSIVFDSNAATGTLAARPVNGTWCSIGTSITWYNNNVATSNGAFTRGYQDRVMDKLAFTKLLNVGDNGGWAQRTIDNNLIKKADYYSIEHGANDWRMSKPVGTLNDYINKTNEGSFAYAIRSIIDRIFSLNKKAKVVLCTPRNVYGGEGCFPGCDEPKNGIYFHEYADLVRQIAEYEGFPVADFFNECGGVHNLKELSIDEAVHPNDDGYQMMANVLIKAFEKIIID